MARHAAGLTLRRGRTNPETLYIQTGESPTKADQPGGDVFAGHARTAQAAAQAVAAVNEGKTAPGCRWWCDGGLVYNRPGADLTRDWVIAVNSDDMAQQIVAAATGNE